jgi:threonine/homoserine/homoserine lactone efflux protein
MESTVTMPPADASLLLFLSTAATLAATPGTGSLYVFTRALDGGWRAGLATVAGTVTGGATHLLVAAFGGAALAARDPSVVRGMSIAGAAYLAYVGARGLWASGREVETTPVAASRPRAFRGGLVVALLNPTTAVFLVAFLPSFVDPRRVALPQLLGLGSLVVALNAVAHLVWVATGAALHGQDTRPSRVHQVLRGAGHVALLALASGALLRSLG